MRRRLERLLLIFSVALNVAFLTTAAIYQRDRDRPSWNEQDPQADPAWFSTHWHGHRAAALDRRLHLERHQRRVVRQHLRTMRPELETTRRELSSARRHFREALWRDDARAVREARQQVSLVQARLDSLTAETMLGEIGVLRPHQRERYVRWTFERRRPHAERMRARHIEEH
jgi:hypothetical protein